MNWGSIDSLVISLIGIAIAFRCAYQTRSCSVRFGHCTCRTCEPSNRLPTAIVMPLDARSTNVAIDGQPRCRVLVAYRSMVGSP